METPTQLRWFNLALICAVLCACGDTGDDSSTTPQNSTRDEIVAPADPKVPDIEEEQGENDEEEQEEETSKNIFAVGGDISGLTGKITLVLRSGKIEDPLEIQSNGQFTFAKMLPDNQSFEVDIDTHPFGQKCLARHAFGTIRGNNANEVSISCATLNTTASLSGTITATAGITVDSDVNDVLAHYESNDDFDIAQPINNIVTLHGFASAEGTWEFDNNDRFDIASDEYDVFQVSLQKGQLIQLQIIDYDEFDIETTYEGDLDLYIADEWGNLVDYSDSIEEYEELIVPGDGDYYVFVNAYEGISKYILQISPPGQGNTTYQSASMNFVPNEMIVKFASQQAVQAKRLMQNDTISFRHQDSGRATLAKMNRSAAKVATMGDEARNHLDSFASLNPIGYQKLLTLKEIKKTAKRQGTHYAEPNYQRKALTIPDDEFYNYQWHYPLINLPQAWDVTTGDSSTNDVIVAVIDTGVYLDHPDMEGKLVDGYDFISSPFISLDGDGIDSNPDDPGDSDERGKSSFHGTHVAGTVAAKSNDGIGAAGVSWGAKIMPIRALGYGGGTTYDIIQGIRYASGLSNDSGTRPSQKADIINLSLGSPGGNTATQEAINEARDAGVIIVSASGNDNSSELNYPASYDGVISVSAVDVEKNRAPYSNYGRAIDIAAPGGDVQEDLNGDSRPDGVLSANVDDTNGNREALWRFYHGTSMAAPHVAGVIALMKSVHPDLTPSQVDSLIQSGALTNDLGASGWDKYYGYGLIDAYKAVQAALNLASGNDSSIEPSSNVIVSPSQVALANSTNTTITLQNYGGENPQITEVIAPAEWLSVIPSSVDSQGLGSYRVNAIRSGLSDGNYQSSITFHLDTQQTLSVSVTMQVGTVNTEGVLTQQYVLLIDAESEKVVQTTLSQKQGNQLHYQFEEVTVGDYFLFTGSDVDNDMLICQSGESCGSYPSMQDIQAIKLIGSDIDNVDMVADILGGGYSKSSADTDNHSSGPILTRGSPQITKRLAP